MCLEHGLLKLLKVEKFDIMCMIVRMASEVNVRDAGYAARERLHYCIIDIVGVFVRVSWPTETDRLRQTDRDRHTESPRQTYRDRPALSTSCCLPRGMLLRDINPFNLCGQLPPRSGVNTRVLLLLLSTRAAKGTWRL